MTGEVLAAYALSGTAAHDSLMRNLRQKKQGSRRVQTVGQISDFGNQRRADEFVDAIHQGQIEVWFQPKVDLAAEEVIGAECLARWRHPKLGVLTPDHFLSLLGPMEYYECFTDEVLQQAFAFAARTDAHGLPIEIAVNLDPRSFAKCELADRLSSMLQLAGVRPSRITLEITESEAVQDLSLHLPVFHSLVAMGADLSVDDFGVGYSSLSRLSKLPVRELKVDRSFVAAAMSEPDAFVIVQAIVELANRLGLRSVAEGLENRATVDLFRDMGCTHGQGYFFAKPMPADEFLRRYMPPLPEQSEEAALFSLSSSARSPAGNGRRP